MAEDTLRGHFKSVVDGSPLDQLRFRLLPDEWRAVRDKAGGNDSEICFRSAGHFPDPSQTSAPCRAAFVHFLSAAQPGEPIPEVGLRKERTAEFFDLCWTSSSPVWRGTLTHRLPQVERSYMRQAIVQYMQ
jgi:hypothetical protein